MRPAPLLHAAKTSELHNFIILSKSRRRVPKAPCQKETNLQLKKVKHPEIEAEEREEETLNSQRQQANTPL